MRTLDRRRAETKSLRHLSPATMAPRRRMSGCAVALLAAALLLALPIAGWAQSLVFSKGSLTVPEDGSTSESYGVKLGRQPDAGVTVTVTVTATEPVTVDRSTLSFTTSNWSKFQSVTVTGAKDDVDNPNDTRTATITHTGTGVATSDNTVTVSVTDDDTAGLSILPTTGLTVYEDGRAAYLQVKLTSAPSAAGVKVEITATPATVTFGAGADSTLTVTFAEGNWNRYQQVQVNAAPDDVDNPGDSRSTAIELDPTDDSSGRYNEVTSVRMTVTIEDDDTKGLTLSPKTVNVTEGDDSTSPSEGTYTVRLNSEPSRPVRLDITSLDPKIAKVSAPGATDGAATTSLTFTRSNWNEVQTVTVYSVPDLVANGDRSVRIRHEAHSGGYDGVTAESEVTITDDDETGLTVGEPSDEPSEDGTTTATISVVLDSKPTGNVRVTASSTNTGVAKVAVEKSDGILGTPAATATLTFTPDNWSTGQTVTVFGVEDKVEDTGGRMVDISFTATDGGYRSITEKETVTVKSDSDFSGISVADFPVTLEEGGAGTSYKVSFTNTPTGTGSVTVTIRSTDTKVAKVAVEKSDGTPGTPAATASLTFTPQNSQNAQTVTVFGVDNDVAAERTATIIHTASSSRIADDGTGKRHLSVTVTNESDDTAGLMPSESEINIKEGARDTYTIKLTSEPTDDVTVEVSSANPDIATATPNTLKFTSGNWKNPRTVTVVGTNNDVDEGSTKSTSIEHIVSSDGEDYGSAQNNNVQVVVIDDDNAGLTVVPTALTISEGRTDTFTVKLDTKPEDGVRLTAGSDDDSIAEVTPEGRDFTPDNWHIPQEFTVTGMRSDSSHIGGRRFTGITISAAAGYNASPEYVDVTVTDEDIVVVPPGLTVTPTSLTVSEGQTGTYTVKLNARPRGSVTVTAASSDTAAATVSPGSRMFTSANWETAQEFTVTSTASSDTTATITNTASGRGYEDVSARVSVTVQANGLVFSKTAVTATEAGTATYTVKLKTQPTGTVTVAVVSSDTAAATVSPASLTFTTSDWSTAQTVTVTGVDDSATNDGGERSTTITHDPAGGGYDAVATVSVPVTVTDIPAGLVLSKGAVTITEAPGAEHTDTYTVRLKTEPTGTVTVAVASNDTDVATVSPAGLTFTTSDWSTAQTVTVTGVDDSADNAADKRTVTISNRSSSAGYDATATVTVTVTDDDAAPELSVEGASVSERNTGTAPLMFTVTKHGDTERVVRVAYADAGTGTATAGTDYTAVTAGTLTFAPERNVEDHHRDGEGRRRVRARRDDRDRAAQSVERNLSPGARPRSWPRAPSSTTTLPVFRLRRVAASAFEGEPLIFTVALDPPIDDQQVTVEVDSRTGTATAGTDYMGVPETLTFAAGEAAKTITVAVADDADYELDETVEVELRNPKPTGRRGDHRDRRGEGDGHHRSTTMIHLHCLSAGRALPRGATGTTTQADIRGDQKWGNQHGGDGCLRGCRHGHGDRRHRLHRGGRGHPDLRAGRHVEDHHRRWCEGDDESEGATRRS